MGWGAGAWEYKGKDVGEDGYSTYETSKHTNTHTSVNMVYTQVAVVVPPQ